MREYAGRAAIGHVRYATCGADDRSYAQPFERHHLQKHKWFSFALQRPAGELSASCATSCWPTTTTIWPATPTPKSSCTRSAASCRATAGRALVEVMRNVSQRFDGAYSLVLLNAHGRHARRPRSAGHQAAVLCEGRPAVRRRQRKRRAAEPGLQPGEHQVAAAGPRDHDRRRPASTSSSSPTARAGRTASSSGSTSRTSPARSTTAASISRARRWAKNSRGWNADGACRSTKTRSSCRCPTPAKPPPTRWPTSWAFRRAKG